MTTDMAEQSLEPRTSTSASMRPRRVGIHGVRSAGKTCYVGSLYGFRAGEAGQLACTDDETIEYLSAVWRDLSAGRVPGATLLAMPTALGLELELPGRVDRTRLELCDYAGQLVQPRTGETSPVARSLTEGVKDWLRSCHAVLIFIDSGRPDMEQIDAIDLLLTDLHGHRDAPALERPVGLVLTKWDSQGTVSDNLDQEVERARAFLAGHPIFRQIHDKLSEVGGERVQLFPVSSFGNHARAGLPPPLHLYQPCHVLAPLAWTAAVSDVVLFEDACAACRAHLARSWRLFDLPAWPRPNHAAARSVWEDLRQGYGIRNGELAAAIDRELEVIDANRHNHWLRNTLVALAVLAGLGTLLHQGRAEADQRARTVQRFHQAHPHWGEAGQRLERTEEFLASWWSWLVPTTRWEMLDRREADLLAVEEQLERPETLQRGKALEQKRNWHDLPPLYQGFLDRYPDSPARACIEEGLARAHEQLDRQPALDEGNRLVGEGKMDNALQVYRQFLERYPRSPARSEFDDRIRVVERAQVDRKEYEAFRLLVRRGDPASLEAAAGRARAYLDSSHPTRNMRQQVERFWGWFEGLRKPGKYDIIVHSLVIPPDSALDPFLGTAEPRVHITLGDTTHTTRWLVGGNLTPGQKLGPFPFRWGQPGTLLVRVESWRRFTSNQWSRGEVADGRFALGLANGTITTRCRKGKSVLVGLRCPAALPPELPPYGGP